MPGAEGKASNPDPLWPLNAPTPIEVVSNERPYLVRVSLASGWQRAKQVEDIWGGDMEWRREKLVRHMCYQVSLQEGTQ